MAERAVSGYNRRVDPDELITLARRQLGMMEAVYYAPHLPEDKLEAMCAVHELTPAEAEPVLVLYDDTVFGGAKEGFIMTPARLLWKRFTEDPRQVRWTELSASSVSLEENQVLLDGEPLSLTVWETDALRRMADLLTELIWRAGDRHAFRSASIASRHGDRPRHLSAGRVLELCQEHLEGIDDVHLSPEIPPRKLANVRALHAEHLGPDEVVLALHDNTLMGGARDGYIITGERICWKNTLSAPRHLPWRYVLEREVQRTSKMVVTVAGAEIWVSSIADLADRTAALLLEIAREGHW